MRALADLLKDWEELGIVFTVREDDRIDIDGAKRLLTHDRLEVIKSHKPSLLKLLRERGNAQDLAELRGWLVILKEGGAKIGIFNGKAEITWPMGWDLPWRLQAWEGNRDTILRLLREAG